MHGSVPPTDSPHETRGARQFRADIDGRRLKVIHQ